jgi:hypothetical protein
MQLRLIACTFSIMLTFALVATARECFIAAHAGPNLPKGIRLVGARGWNDAATVATLVADNGPTQPLPVILGRIFSRLDAQGYDMPFGGDLATTLGLAQNGQLVMVRELPPLRDKTTGIVHIFFQLKDGRGYFVVRYSDDGFIAFRFGPDFAFVVAAARPNGQNSAIISAARAEKMLNEELLEWAALANGMPN